MSSIASQSGLGANLWGPPDHAASEEYFRYAEVYDCETCLQHFDLVAQRSKSLCSNDRVAPIAEEIRRRIDERQPSAFIRIGDGEGNVLFWKWGKYPALADYCIGKISRICFGSEAVMLANASFLADVLIEAIARADLVGGPERQSIERGFNQPVPDVEVRGMTGMRGVYNFLAESAFDLRHAGWGSVWFARSLLPRYDDLLGGLGHVNVISCYEDLSARLAQRYQIHSHNSTVVPMQASIAKSMGKANGHIGLYQRIVDTIRPRRDGDVYIVAAGHLGKGYCSVIKERGGIAIDVGSIADVWMGIGSRPGMSPEFVSKWKLSS